MRFLKRSSTLYPLAFSVQPSKYFREDDGLWSTFNVQVGNPPQSFEVVVSTSSFDIWLPLGCPPSTITPSDCVSLRGAPNGAYAGNTNNFIGIEKPDIGDEGLDSYTLFGFEYGNENGTLYADSLHLSSATGPSTVLSSPGQVPVFGVNDTYWYYSSLGIGVGVRDTTVDKQINSTVLGMSLSGVIPSASWGYTAGAHYDNLRLGSLVLGGYDSNRVNGTTAQFFFTPATATSSELLVSVDSLTINSKSNGPASSPIQASRFDAVIDATLPYLILPNTTCDWLSDELHLTYSENTGLYTINQTALDTGESIKSIIITMKATNPNSTYTPFASITFPYDAFNANATWWHDFNGSESIQPIFPIRRAQSSTAVLGRPFFQEAYVITDYDRNYFNVSQTTIASSLSNSQTLVSLYNDTVLAEIKNQSSSSGKLKAGTIAGIVIGAIAALVIFALILWVFLKRKPDKKKAGAKATEANNDPDPADAIEMVDPFARPGNGRDRRYTYESMSSDVTEIGGTPVRPGRSRQLSELSSDSDAAYRQNAISGLDHIHEMDDKTDAAEYEAYVTRNQQSPPPHELEGEGHLYRPRDG